MVAMIILIAVCGVMTVGNVKGWFEKGSGSFASAEDISGIVDIERSGVSYSLDEKTALRDGDIVTTATDSYAEGIYSDTELTEKCKKYSYHSMPFTKESLFYREIFEKYYPGQAEMICGFWMPNKEWEGCDVDDPSARVLSNYGASGM